MRVERRRRLLGAVIALITAAIALVAGAYATRNEPPKFERRLGTIEELLLEFESPSEPEFASLGVAMLLLAGVAVVAATLLVVRLYKRR